jgi:hypothetical protein
MWNLQKYVYRMGSRSHVVVARRAKQAENFFEDTRAYKWDLCEIDPFALAAWARGRIVGGPKTARASVRQVLNLIQAATGVDTHVNHPLVKGQLSAAVASCAVDEPLEPAREVSVEMMVKFENLVFSGPTPQVRCYSGFFALLGASSLRASDAQRTRDLAVTENAVIGTSRMKGKVAWTRWFADLSGFGCSGWAQEWLSVLGDEGLPGGDFVLRAVTATMDGWLDRPAEYADIRRALHLILITFLGIVPQEAVTFNPHGFRHIMVSIGQQLRPFGIVSEEDLERLGHWDSPGIPPGFSRDYGGRPGAPQGRSRDLRGR